MPVSAQLIESSPVEPLVVGVNLFPGDTWFREIRVVSTTSQQPVKLSAWAFTARLGDGVGTVDASRAAEGILSVTFPPSVTATAKRGTQLTIVGMLDGGRRTFVVGRVGAEVGSSIPVGLVQRKRVVQTDVDISVYAAPRGDKGVDGASVSPALVARAEAAERQAVTAADAADIDAVRAGTSAFSAGQSAASALGHRNDALEAAEAAGAAADEISQDIGTHVSNYLQAHPPTSGARHVQSVPSASWVIPHGFGREPSVTVYVGGVQVGVDVTATSTTVSIAFAAPAAGVAVLT